MKRAVAVIAFILVAFTMFAMNGQEIIPLTSGVYDAMDALFIMEGKAMPSTTRPWSMAEAQKYLSMVSESTSPELYAFVMKEIGKKATYSFDDVVDIRLGVSSAVNAYYHTDTSFDYPFDETENYFFRMFGDNDSTTLNAKAGIYGKDSFYFFFSLQVRNADWVEDVPFHAYNFNSDLAYFSPEGFTYDLDFLVPDRAFISAGGSFWNIELGKDRFSIGAGETGNLILSDSFPFQNLLRFNMFGSRFKFSYALVSFWHPDLMKTSPDNVKGSFLYMTSRVEGYFFSGKLSLSLNNTTVLKNDDGSGFDFRYFNPMDFYHNYFIQPKQNYSAAMEAVFAFAKGWNVYAQYLLDDASSPGEAVGGDSSPDEMGWMFGIRHSSVVGKGVLGLNLEAVYTLPFLYLRSTSADNQPDDDPGLGFVGIVRSAGGGLDYKRYFIGYPYGGDAAVLDLRASYTVPGDFTVKAELFWMIHGEKRIDSKYYHGEKSWALSGEKKTFGYLQLYGRKELNAHIGVYGQYNLGYADGVTDHQFVLGAAIAY